MKEFDELSVFFDLEQETLAQRSVRLARKDETHCLVMRGCENLITHLNQIFLCLNSLVSHACVTLLF